MVSRQELPGREIGRCGKLCLIDIERQDESSGIDEPLGFTSGTQWQPMVMRQQFLVLVPENGQGRADGRFLVDFRSVVVMLV